MRTLPNYILWMVFLFVFSYCGANMPIWRFAQPVNYIGFWIMLITIVLSAIGMFVAPLTGVLDSAATRSARSPSRRSRISASRGRVAGQGVAAALAHAVRDDRLRGDLRLARARRLRRHGAAARVRDRRPPGRRAARCSASTRSRSSRSRRSPSPGVGGGGGRFAAGVGKLIFAGHVRAHPRGLRHRARLRRLRHDRPDRDAARLPRHARDAGRVGGRHRFRSSGTCTSRASSRWG